MFDEAIKEFNLIKSELNLAQLISIKNGYTRNILSQRNGFWLSILNWDSGVETPIHGHPDFAFVYVVSGEIIHTPYKESSENIQAGKYFYNIEKNGKFDNFPHKINIKKPTMSLHFYSDDGRKGKIIN